MTPAPRRSFLLALAGLALALLAVPVYIFTIDNAWLRSSGAAALALMAIGTVIAILAVTRDRRRRVRAVAALTVLVTAAWVTAFVWYAELPQPQQASTMVTAPDFTLPDQDGRELRLHERCATGPTLLVFFRGHW